MATPFSIETLLGDKLLQKVKMEPKSTKALMKDKELIGLYFSASWCPPCKTFSPILADFYNAAAKDGKLEIVYISSDRSVQDFEGYYGKMPWCAVPAEQGSAAVKNNLAQTLKIQGIPSLIVIDAKTGEFITGTAREDVTKAGGDPGKARAVIEQWKIMQRRPLSEATLGGGPENPILKMLLFFIKNPVYIFGLLYLYKLLQKKMKEWNGDPEDAPPMVEDSDTGADKSEF